MYRFRSLIVTGLLALAVNFGGPRTVAAQFDKLIGHVPESANALVFVNAQKMFASPVAQAEGWAAKRESRFRAGLTAVPPHANQLVIAAQLDVEFMHPIWRMAIMHADKTPQLSVVARYYGGALDEIGSVPAVRLPDDSFILRFSDNLLGAMNPSNRQQVSRWIGRKNREKSPYLQEAVRYADSGAVVLMALDLHDAVSADEVKHRLDDRDLEVLKKTGIEHGELAQLIASMKSIMLGITFHDKASGKIKVEFGQDASLLTGIAKPLLLEVLGQRGVMIDEFEGWQAEIKGKQVFLSGTLTENGLMRLASLIELPSQVLQHPISEKATDAAPQSTGAAPQSTGGAPQSTDAAPQSAQQTEKPTMLESTQQYFKSVDLLLKNLQHKKHDMSTMGQLAHWFESYGRHVDRLPVLNVDEEMLKYGSYISDQMHSVSMTLKGININKRVATVGADAATKPYGGLLGDYNGYGGQSYANQYGGARYGSYGRALSTSLVYGMAERRGVVGARNSELRQEQQAETQVTVQARASSATSVEQIVQNIEAATTQVRHDMTQKYQVEF